MYDNVKFVEFNKWCPKCKYANRSEKSDPCNECLDIGANEETSKPVNYIERDDNGSKRKRETTARTHRSHKR